MKIEFIKTVNTVKIAKCDTSLPRYYFKAKGKLFIVSSMFGKTVLLDQCGCPYSDDSVLMALVEKSKELKLNPTNGHDW